MWSPAVGGSSGTNLVGALLVARQMVARRESGSVVAILCDSGERYETTYYNPLWLISQGFDLDPLIEAVRQCAEHGTALPGDLPCIGLD